jgi:hypothetical protein
MQPAFFAPARVSARLPPLARSLPAGLQDLAALGRPTLGQGKMFFGFLTAAMVLREVISFWLPSKWEACCCSGK